MAPQVAAYRKILILTETSLFAPALIRTGYAMKSLSRIMLV
jgi:hypothetical protein